MIVISGDIVLSGSSAPDARNPRIYYDNIVTPANVSADEQDPNEPVINIANPATYLRWRGTSTAEQHVTITLGEAAEVNYWAIAKHNLGSTGATAQLQGSADALSWENLGDSISPSNDYALINEFVELELFNFYRLKITPGSAPPSIAVLYVGECLVLPRRIYVGHSPITMAQRTKVSNGRSESGQFLGRSLRSEMLENDVKQENILPAWLRANLLPFQEASKELPFFFSWRPFQFPNEVAYCWLKNDIDISNQRANGMMTFSLSLQGLR